MLRKKILLTAGVTVLTVTFMFLSGCGSDNPSQPGASVPQGTGSGTMTVTGDVDGKDVAFGVFATDYTVTLADGLGSPVSGATVEITGPGGLIALIEDSGSLGTYRAAGNGYAPGAYTLGVVRGQDRVSGVTVIAPDLHVITSPISGENVTADQALSVVWTRSAVAQEVRLEGRDYDSPAPETDDGQSTIPGTGNPVRNDQRIRVFRLNRVLPAGGLPGSRFEAEIRNSVEPIIAL